MRCGNAPPYSARVTARAIIVSDAHLGFAPPEVTRAFHRFLERVPELGDHLIINGDLFEFWFEYRTVIPRAAFATLAALAALRRAGVRLTVIGGNHDRWGGAFWHQELGAAHHRDAAELELAGLRTLLAHGDGLADPHPAARALQRVVQHRWTVRAFRWIHPDLGIRLVGAVSRRLADREDRVELMRRSATAQAAYARRLLAARTDLDLLVLGHTHRAVLEAVAPQRWYLNPGAWMDGYRFATVGAEGPKLEQFA